MATADLHVVVGAKLRNVGQRYTTRRRALVEILERARQPLAIPEILDAGADLAQSSAYRNLAVLDQAHVVRRVVTGEEFARYELAEDLTEHHHHLVCSNCGRVEDLPATAAVERSVAAAIDQAARRAGFRTQHHRLDLVGVCSRCAS
jgi:Fur family transcriptional regulator, ferric uptake regulator